MTPEVRVWLDQLRVQAEAMLVASAGQGRIYHQALALKLTIKELERSLSDEG